MDLLAQPLNWVTVILMLAIAVFGLALLTAPLGQIGGIVQAV